MSACFLDTCAVLDLMKESEAAIKVTMDFDDLPISQVVFGELIFGCYNSRNPEHELRRVRSWVRTDSIMMGNQWTAEIYGQLAAELESRGSRIPQNDLWIAALAIHAGLPLISRDRHFSRIPGLNLIGYRS